MKANTFFVQHIQFHFCFLLLTTDLFDQFYDVFSLESISDIQRLKVF